MFGRVQFFKLDDSFNILCKTHKLFCTLPRNVIIERFQSVGPELDLEYLCSPKNTANIKSSIRSRKSDGNIDRVIKLHKDYLQCNTPTDRVNIKNNLLNEASKIPNKSHPSLKNLNDQPKIIKTIGSSKKFPFKPRPSEVLFSHLNITKTENLTNLMGPRSYFLIDGLAEVEEALIEYTIVHLLKNNFHIISVPDILPRKTIEYCGMDTKGERTQVYHLDHVHGTDNCLSGTAEMGISNYLQGRIFNRDDLPLRLVAVSRCFRAETSKISIEKGIYRVHQFTKVEMFAVTYPDESDKILKEFLNIQETLFSELGLQLRILDMPECELGAQAYRKFDIECYMPGKDYWGELSSTSNCTDYQSRRLGIKCSDNSFAHTVNGTACAIPRLLIAILETNQNEKGTITIPKLLVPYLGYDTLRKSKMPKLVSFKVR